MVGGGYKGSFDPREITKAAIMAERGEEREEWRRGITPGLFGRNKVHACRVLMQRPRKSKSSTDERRGILLGL